MHTIPYIISSSFPLFVCLFWMLNFLVQYPRVHLSKRILFWFMLTATTLYFGHFTVFNHIYEWIPLTDTIYTFATSSVYPIFYLYIISLTGRLKTRHLFILLPGLILALIVGVSYLCVPDHLMIPILNACHYESLPYPDLLISQILKETHWMLKMLILIEVISILPLGFRRLQKFRIKVAECFSNLEHNDLKDIQYLLIAFVVTSCLSITADVIGRAFFVRTTGLLLLAMIPFSVMLFLLGFIGNQQKFNIENLTAEQDKGKVTSPKGEQNSENSPSLTDKAYKDSCHLLRERIDRILREEQLYLRPDLKLSDLATRLNTNRTYIYDALRLNDHQPLSFPDYVNQFRIEYALTQIKHSSPDFNIEDIVYQSGFVSRSTFYKNFKKFVGCSPLQYIKQNQ